MTRLIVPCIDTSICVGGPFVAGQSTLPVKLPLARVGGNSTSTQVLCQRDEVEEGWRQRQYVVSGHPLLQVFRFERFHRDRQVFVDFENRAKTGNLQELLDSAWQVEQF